MCESCLDSLGDNVEELRRAYKALSDAKEALAVVHDEGLIGWDVYDRGTKALAKAMAQLDLKFLTYDEMKVRELTVDEPEHVCDGCAAPADFEVISDGNRHYFCSDCLNEKISFLEIFERIGSFVRLFHGFVIYCGQGIYLARHFASGQTDAKVI